MFIIPQNVIKVNYSIWKWHSCYTRKAKWINRSVLKICTKEKISYIPLCQIAFSRLFSVSGQRCGQAFLSPWHDLVAAPNVPWSSAGKNSHLGCFFNTALFKSCHILLKSKKRQVVKSLVICFVHSAWYFCSAKVILLHFVSQWYYIRLVTSNARSAYHCRRQYHARSA